MSPRRLFHLVACIAFCAITSCSDSTPPKPPSGPARTPTLTVVSGDLQTSEVGTRLPDPLVVRLADTLGAAAPGIVVRFLRDQAPIDSAITDRVGLATLRWTLGQVATTERIVARALNASEVAFTARATPGAPAQIHVTGDDAIAAPNTSVDTITVVATDRFGNRSTAAPVAWTVTLGGGSVRPLAPQTDTLGAARAVWTMGPAEGDNALEVAVGTLSRRLVALASAGLPAPMVVVGGSHSCALTRAGVAYCWGENLSGQLGIGRIDGDSHAVPERVAGGVRFASLVAGAQHTCGVTTIGEAYCWGSSRFGQLGVGGVGLFPTPTRVIGSLTFAALAAGTNHTCGIVTDSSIRCWGDNSVGQLGDGADRTTEAPISGTVSPVPLAPIGAGAFVAIAAGSYTTCAATSIGWVFCWGSNSQRELGGHVSGRCHIIWTLSFYSGVPVPCTTAPVRLDVPHQLTSIAANGNGWCSVTVNNELLCWGNALDFPHIVAPARIVRVWVFERDVCGLQPTGTILCWGVWGRVGFPDVRPFGGNVALEGFATGISHLCGLSRDGRNLVYCWGNNASGQLGDGTTDLRFDPLRVLPPRGK